MKVDAAKLRQALTAPSSSIRLYLLHGPDEAGAHAAARLLGGALGADAERIDLDGAALRKTPGRLADEAASPSLFGTPRYIRLSAAGEESVEALSLLLAAEIADVPVVAFAPSARTSSALVKLATGSPRAMACAFYPPSAAEVERLAAQLARAQGLIAEAGVARRLAEAAGHDQAVLEQEVGKLSLFLDAAPDRPQPLDHHALDLLSAEHGESSLAALAAALVDGEPATLGTLLEQANAEGMSSVTWLRAVQRRLLALADMRAAVDAGEAPAAVMKARRVFFREEAATAAALRRWSARELAAALRRLRAAERSVIGGGGPGPVVADAAAVAVAQRMARRR